jgi:CcmE
MRGRSRRFPALTMMDDGLRTAMDVARTQVRIDIVAAWAVVGVIAFAVLLATMRQQDFEARIGGSLLVLGAVAGALLWSSLRPPVRCFKHVDEAIAERDAIRAHPHDLQVHGFVVHGSVEQRRGTDDYKFRLESGPNRPQAVMEVRYTGLLPDAFDFASLPDALIPLDRCRKLEVVARGTLAADGRLDVIPDGLMPKRCCD